MWTCWNSSRGRHEDAQRAGAAFLWSQAGRAGGVQHGEGSGETVENRPEPKTASGQLERDFAGQGGMDLN